MRHQNRQVRQAHTGGFDESKHQPGTCSQQSYPANNCQPIWVVGGHFLPSAKLHTVPDSCLGPETKGCSSLWETRLYKLR